jgi:two-component system phosphate regulon response regulator OmpR
MTKICKVLLVEDQHDIRELLREIFSSEGFRFVVVGHGQAMRETLAVEPDIDIVVIDVLLPGGVDGLTLAEEVCDRGLPVILVTGDHQQIEKLDAAGHRYLLKPFRISAFIEMIDEILNETKNRCKREKPPAENYDASV